MVAGHLREKNGYFHIILNYKDMNGVRRTKSISTELPVKGNKKRAEALLLKARETFDPEAELDSKNTLFADFLAKWLKDNVRNYNPETYALYSYNVKNAIIPYFKNTASKMYEITPKEIEGYYQYERTERGGQDDLILQYHEAIKECLQYAVQLKLIRDSPADKVNPTSKETQILFTDFLLEWLGHSDISTTSNIYTHLNFNSKVASANAIIGIYPS
ncbi:MAG: hypothetical protein GX434_12355 [Peptococcaceae bacterium]|nr:hypothetical protein [Peptococcaceae bacterium]